MGVRWERGECEDCSLDQGPLKGVCGLFQDILRQKGDFFGPLFQKHFTQLLQHILWR